MWASGDYPPMVETFLLPLRGEAIAGWSGLLESRAGAPAAANLGRALRAAS